MKPKDQGTRNETDCKNRANEHEGLKAWRLAEGGSKDAGDVAIETADGDTYVLECKHRQQLNPHIELSKTEAKAAAADLPFVPAGVAVQWKRPFKVEGSDRRRNEEVVVIRFEEWLDLISR